jgi:hypothetical protein
MATRPWKVPLGSMGVFMAGKKRDCGFFGYEDDDDIL